MKSLLAALRFLTVLPFPGSWATAAGDLAGSLLWFPVVGALIGAAGAGAWVGLERALPAMPATVLVLALLVLASGGLHLDGLSDAADGLLSSRPREAALEIMRSGRAGPMGVFAIAAVLGLKFTAISFTYQLDEHAVWRVFLLMPVAGRAALLLSMAVLPYARPAGGLGSPFYAGPRKAAAAWGLGFLAAAGGLVAGWAGLVAAGAAAAVTLLFAVWVWLRLGGATGDTLGAACELAEAAAALALAGCFKHHLAAAAPGWAPW